jgi:transcriptional regulator with XRE-family HTH domain
MIGERIKARRKELGLTLREAVHGTGYSHTLLSRIEGGDRNATIEFLIAISQNLRTTAMELESGHRDEVCPFCRRRSRV